MKQKAGHQPCPLVPQPAAVRLREGDVPPNTGVKLIDLHLEVVQAYQLPDEEVETHRSGKDQVYPLRLRLAHSGVHRYGKLLVVPIGLKGPIEDYQLIGGAAEVFRHRLGDGPPNLESDDRLAALLAVDPP